ncbi:MAG TPA: ABC transporter ATP-binding protein [Candidatus Nanoarchaeia archaeon]|nr:ABC transporter ATP-binding protein [Candidatus Nanoarchaeia archaeon]
MNNSTKFVLDIFEKNKKQLVRIIIVATFGALLTVITPYIYGKLFDLAIIPDTVTNILFSLIGLWLVLSLISTYVSNMTGYMGEVLGTKMSQEAEAEAYSHFLTLPILFHKKEQRGEILQKISRGSRSLQEIIETIADVSPQLLMLLFSLIAMFIIKWQLALIVFISFVVYALFTIRFVKPEIAAHRIANKVYEKQYGNVYDKLYNVFLVKNFVMENVEKERFFKSLVGKILPAVKNAASKSRKLSVVQGIIYSISFVAVLGSAIFFLREGNLSPGQFVMFFGYINLAFGPFRFFGMIYRRYKRAGVAIRRFLKLRKISPEKMSHGNKILKEVKGEIFFKGLDFGYIKGKPVLRGINLKINPGESVALVGKSGVGKTTLAELVMGYYQPGKGKITLDGVDISELQLKWLRDQIAVVPQDLNLFNDTMINNLRYANPIATEKQIADAAKAASADEFINQLPKKYQTKVGEEGVKLSMGQRQRVAITMAFLKNPKILILDEPTAALDAESEKKVQEGINRLIKEKTTIIIAHRFSTVRNADKIVVLDKGRIAELGNHEELMKKKGIYYNLYTLQKGLD